MMKRRYLSTLVIGLVFLTALLMLVALQKGVGLASEGSIADEPELEWVIECVDCPKMFRDMTDRSIQLDAAGYPHIAYGWDFLYYAWYDGEDWHLETVDDTPGVGRYASLALDGDGYPHISYRLGVEGYDFDLKYAYKDASGWYIHTIDNQLSSNGEHQTNTSIALDRNGNPHISYAIGNSLEVKTMYATLDATGWHTQTVDSQGGFKTSLALDGDGYPHISYFDGRWNNGDLKYATLDASGWHTQTVESNLSPGNEFTSLVLDRDGYPHISYAYCIWNTLSTVRQLNYAKMDVSGWHTQTVDSMEVSQSYFDYNSLALDGDGYPHISYAYRIWETDPNVRQLNYAKMDASGWHTQTVDSEGEVGLYTSLALNVDGYPHISYYDSTNEDLKYTNLDATGWHTQKVDSVGDKVGLHTSLALDESGYPHVSYEEFIDGDHSNLKYAYKDATGWHTQTVANEGPFGMGPSLSLDGDGYPHISYDPAGNLKYAYQDSSGWYSQTVGDCFSFSPSMELDGDGNPHVSYYGCGRNLMYATLDAPGWTIQTADNEGEVGETNSLDLDNNGYPHISYSQEKTDQEDKYNLKYTYLDATGWHSQTVDSFLNVGYPSSLSLDGDGYPHISYSASFGGSLRYARLEASGWFTQSVGRGGEYNSLALDESGYPHISYFGYSAIGEQVDDLKYAFQDITGWHIQTLDSQGDVGRYNSMALNRDGYPHISYYDATNQDLKYAYLRPTSYPLSVSLAGEGSGSVSSTPAGISCNPDTGRDCTVTFDYGITVTLTATADSGSIFAGWGGDCSGTDDCAVTMTETRVVTATFNVAAVYLPLLSR